MRVAFLNLCHTEPEIVARVADKLTKNPDFDMYIHVDAKSDIIPFRKLLGENQQVFFIENRVKVYWGGFNAIEATYRLLETALSSNTQYDYYFLLQNLDYPIKSNEYITSFLDENQGTEYIRGCNISKTKDLHYALKYRLYYERDDEFYLSNPNKVKRTIRHIRLMMKSLSRIGFNGVIRDGNVKYELFYGAAQWCVTKDCAKYFLDFRRTQTRYDQVMSHIQFPDEEYFHTLVHNSSFKSKCVKYDEKPQRWLVNWRNLHYFEFPREVTIMDESFYEKVIERDELFIRKVKTGISDRLMDRIDALNTIEKAR